MSYIDKEPFQCSNGKNVQKYKDFRLAVEQATLGIQISALKCHWDEIFTLTFFLISLKCRYRKPTWRSFMSIFKKNEDVIEERNLEILAAIEMAS